ncbi:MBL fold metallo-hydrolase [Aromatoleum diolicum]|uniref:MBL fold metallo-hydrolase n=2 Tax=Aromatoleum diolicum TaxID=75796 RepID=A0ABX1QFA2_9RHOO|nr:MBL fold metallo-hydrolase [Aromatoleum diolicum]NMG77123.1 MBL fold metallo-hydrolase [Aromatoleum diolicum]
MPDHGLDSEPANAARTTEALDYPFAAPAPDGEVVTLAPGILWARMPMPMQLDHINVYLLYDGDGWLIVDTGLNTEKSKVLWEEIVASHLDGLPVKGLICTHFHYDHAGLAAWLTERFDVPLYMTHGEFFTMRGLNEQVPEPLPAPLREFYARAGMPDDRIDRMFGAIRRDPFMPPQPHAFRRLRGGDVLTIGGREWKVVIGEGHSPEHACLYCEADRILIAGDQLLPRITSNVLVSGVEPEANPLQLWLESLNRLDRLEPETLVLPSHQLVFRGLRRRVQELRDHHSLQFDVLREFVRSAGRCSAFEAMGKLFPRLLGAGDDMLAIGETIAHLAWLRYRGELSRILDDDGIYRFSAAV